jgi:plastocyanin/mono/diheme cytochrome c family protein
VGAVQKLATVVIIGLVALATVLVVYLADEPNRRDSETTEQEALALERGTELYVTYCLQCHGPSGYGSQGNEDPIRIGKPLNQAPFSDEQLESLSGTNFVPFQSDDPAEQEVAENYLRYMITYGMPQDPRVAGKVMPAFGQELNVEEINDLVYLIMHGNWDYVYNQAVLTTGHNYAQGICDATPTDEEACENAHNEDYALYPTVPPDEEEGEESTEGTPAADGEGGILIEAEDTLSWSQTEVTVKPGDTIQVVNAGVLEHDFTVDELGIAEVLTPEPVTITIPEDAAPGEYEFYCSIPGHAQGGMVGTLIVEAP